MSEKGYSGGACYERVSCGCLSHFCLACCHCPTLAVVFQHSDVGILGGGASYMIIAMVLAFDIFYWVQSFYHGAQVYKIGNTYYEYMSATTGGKDGPSAVDTMSSTEKALRDEFWDRVSFGGDPCTWILQLVYWVLFIAAIVGFLRNRKAIHEALGKSQPADTSITECLCATFCLPCFLSRDKYEIDEAKSGSSRPRGSDYGSVGAPIASRNSN